MLNSLFVALAASLAVRAHRELRSRERLAAASLEVLLNAIDANDRTTGAHVRRVADYALRLARAAGLDERGQRSVERVALFHDIGKIHAALFDIVHEGTRLNAHERELIATHPQRGADVLRPLARFYPDLWQGVLAHHERWNGTGYPRALRGADIPLTARIVAIADTFDVITHSRPYKAGQGAREAAAAIREGRGTQFDPALVDIFLSPSVFRGIERSMRPRSRPPPPLGGRRRAASPPTRAPDVTFRWRTEGLVHRAPDHSTQTPPR
ncbi:MAG: HD domain-containing protein [Gemmatimonadota bacterium]|nr:HD domain-containing protein [Gemmatimonadota bacterium]